MDKFARKMKVEICHKPEVMKTAKACQEFFPLIFLSMSGNVAC